MLSSSGPSSPCVPLAAEAEARARLLELDESPESPGGGWGDDDVDDGRDGSAPRFEADDVREVTSRLERFKQHETEMQAEEYAELQRVYQRHIKRSIRAMRRMPGEPPATTMCTEEDFDAVGTPCDAEGPPGGYDAACAAGSSGVDANGQPRLHYDHDVYHAHIEHDDVVSALVGSSPSRYAAEARSVASADASSVDGGTHTAGPQPRPPGRSRFVGRLRRARLRGAAYAVEEAEDEEEEE